jgi:hypothetical protein
MECYRKPICGSCRMNTGCKDSYYCKKYEVHSMIDRPDWCRKHYVDWWGLFKYKISRIVGYFRYRRWDK